ncbi:TPA: hypothetical protein JZG45_005174 [Escherichia coli]|nr:hypothetical protein [Escherichia coli]
MIKLLLIYELDKTMKNLTLLVGKFIGSVAMAAERQVIGVGKREESS